MEWKGQGKVRDVDPTTKNRKSQSGVSSMSPTDTRLYKHRGISVALESMGVSLLSVPGLAAAQAGSDVLTRKAFDRMLMVVLGRKTRMRSDERGRHLW